MLNILRVFLSLVRWGSFLFNVLCEMFRMIKEVSILVFSEFGSGLINWLEDVLSLWSVESEFIVLGKILVNRFVERLICCRIVSLLILIGIILESWLYVRESWFVRGRVEILVGMFLVSLLNDKFRFCSFGNVVNFVIKFFVRLFFCKLSNVKFFKFWKGIGFWSLFLFKFISVSFVYRFKIVGIGFVRLFVDMLSFCKIDILLIDVGIDFISRLFVIFIEVRFFMFFKKVGNFLLRWLLLRFKVFKLVVCVSFIGIVLVSRLLDKLSCFNEERVLR